MPWTASLHVLIIRLSISKPSISRHTFHVHILYYIYKVLGCMSASQVDMHSRVSKSCFLLYIPLLNTTLLLNLFACTATKHVLIYFCSMLSTLTFRSRQQWLVLLDLCPSLHCPEQTSQNLLRLHDWLVWIPSSLRLIHPHLMSPPACNKNT